MKVSIYRSFNLDNVVEHITDVTYANTEASQIAESSFSIIQNNFEPSMILKFFDDSNNPIDFSPTSSHVAFTVVCSMGFKTTLLNQTNNTTNRILSSYDNRFDTNCYLAIDQEKMKVIGVTENKILGRVYLTVKRYAQPFQQHYRDSVIRVIRSYPTVQFLDAVNGVVKVFWNLRDVLKTGSYDLEIAFDRKIGNQQSKWSVTPIRISVLDDYQVT
jgi:hypothetical protein